MSTGGTYDKAELLRMVKGIVHVVMPETNANLFVFGSQAGLKNWKPADVDLGIDTGEPIEWSRLNTIKELIAALPTIYKFDVVDFNRVSDRFKEVALRNTETI